MATKAAKPPLQKSAPTSSGNAGTSLQVSLPQMLDLALGTPEVGAVNLNILHNFLHVVLHQINLRTTKVEYRGDDADRIKSTVASLRVGPSLHLHEYSITDGSGKVKQRIHSNENLTINVDVFTDADVQKTGKGSSSSPSTARPTQSKQNTESGTSAKKIKGMKQQISGGVEGDFESVIFIEPILDGATPTALGFKKLEDSVQKLQQQFRALEELATNPELINKVRGNSTDPLTDMWQIININKRLDASEQGINKLTSMLQDVIKGDKIEIQSAPGGLGEPDVSPELAEIDQRLANLEANVAILYEMGSSEPQETLAKSGVKLGAVSQKSEKKDPVTTIEKEIESQDLTENKQSQRSVAKTKSEGGKIEGADGINLKENKSGKSVKRPSITMDLNEMRGDINGLKNDITEVRQDIAGLQFMIEELPSQGGGGSPDRTKSATGSKKNVTEAGGKKSGAGTEVDSKTKPEGKEKTENTGLSVSPNPSPGPVETSESETTEEKLKQCLEAVQNVEAMYADAILELNTRVQELERDVALLMEKVNNAPIGGIRSEGGQVMNELIAKIQNIQTDMEKLNQTTNKMLEEKENLDTQSQALQEQIELLKTVKADKEDLEDALADKADTKAVNRKVSYDQFDATCDDLTRGLEEAITKLSQQESVWQHSLDEIQQEIGSKLDKVEISPLKEFVDSKVKTLQEKLKTLSDIRQENEAAATKKMLRDVQCLSCDKNVVMRVEESNPIRAPPMPYMKSIKPYLTYELDQIRKQQKKLPQRNMLQFEAALQEERKMKVKEEPLIKTPRDHLCNRYCGGSHTIVTPQQKVMRIGHFIKQWGPQIVQLSEGFIEGTDGQMYRSRLMVDGTDGKKQVICEPCDNRCNLQRPSKENVSPMNGMNQAGPKKTSSISLSQIEKGVKKSSIAAQQRISREPSEVQLPEEQPPPPPSPPTRQVSLIKSVSLEQTQVLDRTLGGGSFAEDGKDLARISFEEDDEIEGHEG